MTPDAPSFRPSWSAADVDAARLWSQSGAAWLCDARLGVPRALVAGLAGVVGYLDERGAGLQSMFGSAGIGLLAERAAIMRLGPADRISCGRASRLVRCADGWMAVTLARADDVDLLAAWLEIDPIDELDVWTRLEALLAGRSRDTMLKRASLLGLPCSAIGEVCDGPAVVVSAAGEASARPLAGAVVVNLASLWAGPLCADVLHRLGARVIKVESLGRPDGGRAAGRFFEALHSGSESVAFDLRTSGGQRRLAQLVAQADVVIEGSRPRALEQMGIDARSVVASGPQIWLSITGHGRSGEAASRVGFGDDAAVAGGLVGWVKEEPRFVADAIADPLTGVTAAATVVELLERGGRWLVDAALARVASSLAGDWLPAATGLAPERPRPRAGTFEPLPLGRDTSLVLAEFGID